MSTGLNATPSRWRAVAKILLLIALLVAANLVARQYLQSLDFEIRPSNEDMVHRTIMASAALYALLLAVPFVPGAEIGLALIAMLGPAIAYLVYLCTIAGLMLAFLVGRLIPLRVLIHLAQDCKLERTAKLLYEIAPLDKEARLALLVDKAPKRFIPFLLRHRYLALAAAVNIPGNYLIGGGGGISLMAGISRLFSIPAFLLTVALAVAPVPLAVLIFGTSFIGV